MTRICKRDGCSKPAPVDVFCSTLCAKIVSGALPTFTDEERLAKRRERRNRLARTKRLQAKMGTTTDVVNPDATAHVISGGYGSKTGG